MKNKIRTEKSLSKEQVSSVKVGSDSGHVSAQAGESTDQTIDLRNLESGAYILKVFYGFDQRVQQRVKQQ